jgi:aryl carrier-like protein
VWAESLGLRTVGIDDNFFDLGGDSIRSIKVRAKALERDIDFSLQQLFENPTIRKLAPHIVGPATTNGNALQQEPFTMISDDDRRKLPSEVEDAYPLSQLQAGMVFHSEYSPDYLVYVSSLHLRLRFDAALISSSKRLTIGFKMNHSGGSTGMKLRCSAFMSICAAMIPSSSV